MNNAQLTEEKQVEFDRTPWLRQREGELAKIIEAIGRISDSEDWSILKTHVFDGLVQSLDKRINEEAKKTDPNIQELARLAGQYVWAQKFSDLDKLREFFKTELLGIRKQIHG